MRNRNSITISWTREIQSSQTCLSRRARGCNGMALRYDSATCAVRSNVFGDAV